MRINQAVTAYIRPSVFSGLRGWARKQTIWKVYVHSHPGVGAYLGEENRKGIRIRTFYPASSSSPCAAPSPPATTPTPCWHFRRHSSTDMTDACWIPVAM